MAAAPESEALNGTETDAIREELKGKADVILGSSSISRQNILREMGLEFTIFKAGIDEKAIRKETPEDLVVALAKAKAEAIIAKMKAEGRGPAPTGAKSQLLITADQVVTYQGKIREKPESPEEAREWIRSYSKAPGGTVGCTMVTNLGTGFQAWEVDVTQMSFDEIPDANIDKMMKEGFVFYCAGALMVEHPLVAPYIKDQVGTTDAIMGLPIYNTWKLLKRALHPEVA